MPFGYCASPCDITIIIAVFVTVLAHWLDGVEHNGEILVFTVLYLCIELIHRSTLEQACPDHIQCAIDMVLDDAGIGQ